MYSLTLLLSFFMFFANKIKPSIGIVMTHMTRIGNPITNHHIKCSPLYQSMSVYILTLATLSSILTHWNTLNELSARVGCKRKMTVINDIAMFRFMSDIQSLFTIYVSIHSNKTIIKMMIGRNAIRNSLKIEFDGNGPLISVSVTNQSNDKNVSDDDPTLFTG